ncbi:hypothetical protein MRY87_12405 [bacterium]|nr:hypothetical protein [bacterium]
MRGSLLTYERREHVGEIAMAIDPLSAYSSESPSSSQHSAEDKKLPFFPHQSSKTEYYR